jgi:2-hydroxy-6-oxonona-2,4-dienedioate hydrolase
MTLPQVMEIVFILSGVIIALFLLILYIRYRSEILEAYRRVSEKTSRIIRTRHGPVEFTTYGQGHPVIIVHGIWGGFDQGLAGAQGMSGEKYQLIIPSRFGYLRTPLPDPASAALQADQYAALLDAMNIKKAVIVGTSAGGTSAVWFAIRHPDRCLALILKSTNVPENQPPPSGIGRVMMDTLVMSDFFLWLIMSCSPSTMMAVAGIPDNLRKTMTQDQREWYTAFSRTFLPTVPRSRGILFDAYISNTEMDAVPFETITVPTLVFHAKDDPMPPYACAEKMAGRIPDAVFVGYEQGGHLLLGHEDDIRNKMDQFIADSIAVPTG